MNKNKSTDNEPEKKPGHEGQNDEPIDNIDQIDPEKLTKQTDTNRTKKKKGNGFDDWSVTWP